MTPEANLRLGHALQESLGDNLTRSAVQEVLRMALLEEPSLWQIWPDVDALLAGCARMRDWEQGVALAYLVGFVGGDLKVWQGRVVEGLRLQQEEGARLDQQIDENLRGLGYEF